MLVANRAVCDVSDKDARRIRQIVEAGRANYRAFDNFVCRLRIRAGRPRKGSDRPVPEIATELQVAEARWVRKGTKEYYAVRTVRSTPEATPRGELVKHAYILAGVFVHDGRNAMIRDPGLPKTGEPLRLRVSDDANSAPMEILHTWNTYGSMYNDRGVLWTYLSQLLSSVRKPRKIMLGLSVVQEKGRRLEKITFDLGGEPPTRNTVWADPTRGYLAVRNTSQVQGYPPRTAVIEEARRYGEHWFPWKARVFYADPENFCFETEVLELKLGAARDVDFTTELPRKSEVISITPLMARPVVLNEKRRVALNDVPSLLAKLASQPVTDTSPRAVGRKENTSWWKWGLLATGTAMVFAGLYLRFRRT